jgi:hypothetical protein
MRAGVAAVWSLALAALPGGGCSTVDLGDPPADVNACRPSQTFFVEHVWPEFLNQSHNGKLCSDVGCHNQASGRLLVLLPVPAEPPPIPLDPTTAWGQNYRSAAQQMICTNVRGSELFTRPGGLVTHGSAGALIDPVSGPEGPLLDMWVTAQP